MREARERAGLNLGTLADLCEQHGRKVHRTTLGKLEAGRHLPSPELLQALKSALAVDLDVLLDDSTPVAS